MESQAGAGRHPASTAKIGIVGLGLQGAGIGALLLEQGYSLVGAVDVGEKVGRPVSEHVPGATADAVVHDSVKALLNAAAGGLDAVVLAAAIDAQTTVALARELMAAGISVLTLHADLFEPQASWAAELDLLGRSTGAGFLSTGVQDTWWVHMPALAAASTRNIRRISITHLVDINSLSAQVGREIGVGESVDRRSWAPENTQGEQPVLGSPLREAARRIGLVPKPGQTVTTPVVAEKPTWWESGNQWLAPGTVIGTEETTSFGTDGGIDFVGTLRTVPLQDGEVPSDLLVLDADPALRLEHSPFPGTDITNIALVARIPDVLAAGGGVHSASTLPAARYRRSAAGHRASLYATGLGDHVAP